MNLLPHHEQRAIRRTYLKRVGVVGVGLACAVVGFAAALLAPSAILSTYERFTLEATNESLSAEVAAGGGEEAARYLAETEARVAFADELFALRGTRETLRVILAAVPEEVTISSVALTQERAAPRLQLSGVAADRATLITFIDRLEALPVVADLTFPLEDLAQSIDTPFAMTLTLTAL
ncbi:hypothetical protein GVX82_02595 [Patescibacteria group bacterium]|jgi:Tfp pilus assembly protein PilN|nr:hypothetical protein [Patescibacteria group bacterium]